MIKALTNPRCQARETMALALGAIGDDRAVPVLLGLLDSPELGDAAAVALGRFGEAARKALPVLRKRLTDPPTHASVAAAFAVWRIDGSTEEVVPHLIRAFESFEAPLLRQRAAAALARIGPDAREAVEALQRPSWHDGTRVRQAAALWAITKQTQPGLRWIMLALARREIAVAEVAETLEQMGSEARAVLPILDQIDREELGDITARHTAARIREK
jgi:HEAT repeat protein